MSTTDLRPNQPSNDLTGADSINRPQTPEPPSGKPRQRTLRFRLACLVLACVLPVCVIAAFVVHHAYQQRQKLLEQRVLETTRALSLVVDQQFAAMQAGAAALATSPALAKDDFATFYKQVKHFQQENPGLGDVNLSGADGQQYLNSYVPFGSPLPKRQVSDVMRRVFETGKPGITNLFKGALTGRHVFAVEVPVFIDGHVQYDLVFAVPAEHFSALLSQQGISSEWTVTIQDANHVLVARNRFPEKFVGTSAQPVALSRMAAADEGSFEIPNQEGVDSVVMFHRSPVSGWLVFIAIPKAVVLAGLRQWLWWAVGGSILLLIMGLALALFLAQRIAASIHALIPPALALGSGQPVAVEPLDLAETNELGQSLVKASQLLQQRTAERNQAEQRIAHLASFPELNSNPILEIDLRGKITYANPAAWRRFPDIVEAGTEHPILNRWSEVIAAIGAEARQHVLNREVETDGSVFQQSIHYIPDIGLTRIYFADITERKQAENELQQAKRYAEDVAVQLRSIVENMAERLYVCDSHGHPILTNAAFRRTYPGIDVPEYPQAFAEHWEAFDMAGNSVPVADWPIGLALRGQNVRGAEFRIRSKHTGEDMIGSYNASPVFDSQGKVTMALFTSQDIAERKRAEEQLRKLNRTLTALSNSNQALMHSTDELALLQGVCQIITEDCGYAMVWIGIAENDEDKTVRPVAHAGFEEGYLEAMRITWADNERGRGPTGTAIRTGQPSMCRNMLTDPAFLPWRADAIKRGYASSLVVPLKEDDQVFGAITIYSREPDTFTEGEVSLLTELAGDLAYGINALRMRAAHAKAEEERETTVEFLRLVNQSRGTRDLIHAATTFFQQRSACEAVGIRLQEGDDYPYYEARGFPKHFVQLENSLCSRDAAGKVILDNSGNPAIDCMCGNVIRSRFDPSKPFFTANGSFWANDTTRLLATTTDADRQARTRNRCNGEGYESVALIPLRIGDQRLGLLQLNDHQKGRFSLETILQWERLADYLAVALSKFRAEEALRQAAEFDEVALKSLGEGLYTVDTQGLVTSINPAGEELFGWSFAELRGKKMHDLTHHHYRDGRPFPSSECAGFQVLTTGRPLKNHEDAFIRKDGTFFDVIYSIAPMRDTTGQITGLVVVFSDITEIKRAQEALRQSESQFRELAEGIPQLAWTANPDGWIYWYNQRWYQYTGTTPEQMEGWGWQSVHDPNELPQVMERWKVSIATGEPFGMVFPLLGADGVFRPFLTRVMPLRDAQGRVVRWFGTNTDISEQRRAEATLRQQADMLRLSFDAILVWRLDGAIESWNVGAEQLYGYSESEALGRVSHDLLRTIHPRPWPEIEAELREERFWEGELHHFTKDGREVVVSARKQLIRGADDIDRVLEINRDITERKQAEIESRAREQRLRLATDAAQLGIFEWHVSTDTAVWENKRMYEIFGIPETTDPVNRDQFVRETLHPEDLLRFKQELEESMQPGALFRGAYRIRRVNDGQLRWIQYYSKFELTPDGKPLRLMGVLEDITERKQAEETLRQNEERWATTLRSIGDAVISTCARGKIIFMNDVAQALTGWTIAEAYEKDLETVFNIVNEVTRIKGENPVSRVIRHGQIVGLANHTALISRDGTEYPIEDSAAPIRNKDGEITGIVLVFHDVLEKRKAEKAVQNSERLATTGRLAATLAHEIHNPLDTVGNLLYLLDQTPNPEEARQYLALASQEVGRVTQMTRHMLAFQRESNKPVPVNVAEILESVVVLFERKIQSAGIQVEKRIQFEQEFIGLPGEMRQVFANLFGNAVEAVGKNGKIRLSAHAVHNWRTGEFGLRVVVADNGPGIQPNIRGKIFEPFFTTKGEAGTGLGLWITSGIVHNSGGTLRLRTVTRGGRTGTCFSVFLPLK